MYIAEGGVFLFNNSCLFHDTFSLSKITIGNKSPCIALGSQFTVSINISRHDNDFNSFVIITGGKYKQE